MPETTHNRVTLLGRLTRAPEIRDFDNGKVAIFTVATTATWRGRDGEPQERSQFHPVAVWNAALIEATAPHLKPGSRVLVEGALEHRSYKAGEATRYVTEVVLRPFHGSIGILTPPPRRPAGEREEEDDPPRRRRAPRPKPPALL